MFDQSLREVMARNVLLTASPMARVQEVARDMANCNAGAVVVVDADHAVGIFTERDAVFRVIAKGLDPAATCLADVMTAQPQTLDPECSYGRAMVLMQEHGFRHVPVVDSGKVVGIVTSRNAMDPELEEFVSEERRREHWQHDPK